MDLQFYFNGTDVVIAANEQDAIAIWEEQTGESWLEDEYDPFELLTSDIIRVIWVDEEPKEQDVPPDGWIEMTNDGGYYQVAAPSKRWIEKCGRCYFSCTEW